MITFILNILYNFITGIIALFPSGTGFPTAVHTGVSTLGGYMYSLNALVPLSTLKICLLLVFAVEIVIFAFKTFKWLISHIPWLGGKGN